MGGTGRINYTPTEREEMVHKIKVAHTERLMKIERFAMKVTTIAIDNIVAEIIRPGPKPEERECYDVANEIRAFSPFIVKEIMKAIIVESKESENNEVISPSPGYINEDTIKEFLGE